MTQYLPPNLLALFAPRDPIPYLTPLDKLPWEKKPWRYNGVSECLKLFEDSSETPAPTRGETREERIARKRQEREERHRVSLEEKIEAWDPSNSPIIQSDPFKTLFVGRINYDTSESKLRREFEQYGPVKKIKMVSDSKTDKPCGYAFIEYENERDMHAAYKYSDGKKIDGRRVVVDVERGRTVKSWKPRRLGGGLGGTRRGAPQECIKYSGRVDERDMDRNERERERDRGNEDRDRGPEERGRSREQERDRGPEERGRSREQERDRGNEDRDRDRDRDRERRRDRSRERGGDRDRRRDRDKDRDKRKRSRSRERDRERKERSRSRDRKDRDKKDRDKDKERERERDRDREKDRKTRDKDRDRDRDRDKGKDRDRDKEKSRDEKSRDKNHDQDKERDRKNGDNTQTVKAVVKDNNEEGSESKAAGDFNGENEGTMETA